MSLRSLIYFSLTLFILILPEISFAIEKNQESVKLERQIYKVKYSQLQNGKIIEKDDFFESLVRYVKIDDKFYFVRYDTECKEYTKDKKCKFWKWSPYIEYQSNKYPVICQSKLVEKEAIVEGEKVKFQVINQQCFIENMNGSRLLTDDNK
jgi:hypothetical protein